jgi:hypothetical protein
MRFSLLALLALGLLAGAPIASQAQDRPRFGAGLQLMGSTVDNNVGPGVRFRTSVPINRDLSLGLGAALTGYVFEGRDDAAYAFDPQTSLIVTLPGSSQERTYVLGGAGAYVPFGNTDAASGPTIHLGVGKVWLLSESSFFAEVDPALFVGAEETHLIVPLRVGVIF